MARAAILVIAAVLAAGCATTTTTTSSVTTTDNIRVCQHYRAQRAWVLGLTQPTLADGLKFATDVAVDAAESTGTVGQAFKAMSADERHNRSSYAASGRVLTDCEHLGVKFT